MNSRFQIPIRNHEYQIAKLLAKSTILVQRWKELAHALDVGDEDDLTRCKKEESAKLIILQILTHFVSKSGNKATFAELIKVLWDEEFKSAAESIELFCDTEIANSTESYSQNSRTRRIDTLDLNLCHIHKFACTNCEWEITVSRYQKPHS